MKNERWGIGPWDNEPDRVEWRTAAGYPALARRNSHFGFWCGYVAVPPGHPWHGQEDIPAEVHGGITYTHQCAGDICHVPGPGEPDDVWWVGFDCGHASDLHPAGPLTFLSREVYRDLEYVKAQAEALAAQAKEQA
jgi:hypothetical protein